MRAFNSEIWLEVFCSFSLRRRRNRWEEVALRFRFSSAVLDLSFVSTATGIMPSCFSMVIVLDGIEKTKVGLA